MAADVKIEDLDLPEELQGLPVHIMVRETNPPTRPRTVAAVGYHQDATDIVEWFDVNGTPAQAAAVISAQVVPAVREYLQVAPPLPAAEAEPEPEADKPLTAAQVKAVNKRAAAAAGAKK